MGYGLMGGTSETQGKASITSLRQPAGSRNEILPFDPQPGLRVPRKGLCCQCGQSYPLMSWRHQWSLVPSSVSWRHRRLLQACRPLVATQSQECRSIIPHLRCMPALLSRHRAHPEAVLRHGRARPPPMRHRQDLESVFNMLSFHLASAWGVFAVTMHLCCSWRCLSSPMCCCPPGELLRLCRPACQTGREVRLVGVQLASGSCRPSCRVPQSLTVQP